jgi:hypothetical protein
LAIFYFAISRPLPADVVKESVEDEADHERSESPATA